MQYRDSNVISYASIQNNNQEVRIIGNIDSDVVKVMYMILDIVSLGMKEEPIQEGIYKSLFQEKLFIERRKRGKKFITLIIHIN